MSNKSLNFWKLISTFVLLPPWVLLGIGINLTMIAWAWVSILLSWHLYYKSCSWDFHSGKKWKMCRKTTVKAINSIGMKINIIISCEIVRENWYVFKFFHEWLRKWGRPIASTCFLLWNHRMTPTVPEQVFPQPLPFYQPSIMCLLPQSLVSSLLRLSGPLQTGPKGLSHKSASFPWTNVISWWRWSTPLPLPYSCPGLWNLKKET